ncbi:MAG: shikimate dehydrogenase [Clostridia bacterium]
MEHFALIGEKLGHSLSLPIHRLYCELTGTRADYRLIELAPEKLPELRALMAREDLSGVNITLPYKQAALLLMDHLSPEARKIGAVNTVTRIGDALTGENTDVFGFTRTLAHEGIAISGKTFGVLGASGGAAQAVVYALLAGGAKQLYLVSRKPLNRPMPGPRCAWVSEENLCDLTYDVLVNATPVGMFPHADACPADPIVLLNTRVLIDLIYNPAETRFLQIARASGHLGVNGLYMLVAQAVRAEQIWHACALDAQADQAACALTDAIYEEMCKAPQS